MMYAEVDTSGNVIRYPASPMLEHPGTAFRREWPGGLVGDTLYETVATQPQPPYDPSTYAITEGLPLRVDGNLVQSWELRELTQTELDDRLADWRAMVVCSRFQALAALQGAGLLITVQALVDNPAADPLLKLAWENALEFRRTSPMVEAIGAAAGISDTSLDELFKQALLIAV